MFLPIFNNKYNEDEWVAVCDLENLGEKEKGYCVTQGTDLTPRSITGFHTSQPAILPGGWRGLISTTRSTPSIHSMNSTPSTSIRSLHQPKWHKPSALQGGASHK